MILIGEFDLLNDERGDLVIFINWIFELYGVVEEVDVDGGWMDEECEWL